MTFREANNMIDDISWFYGGESITTDDIVECREICHKALEKQIPKKPDYEADGYDENGNLIYDRAICPNCGNDDFEYDINNWGCKFCPDCGQALDWSDTE